MASQRDRTTTVGKYVVPLKDLEKCKVVRFSDGLYAFWVCVLKKNNTNRVTRNLVGYSAGERFERFYHDGKPGAKWIPAKARPLYMKAWREEFQQGRNVAFIRPATDQEIQFWLSVHPQDARCVVFG